MKRILKWIGIVVGAVLVLAGAGIGYLFVAFPKVPPPSDVNVQATPELVERGQYLANHVTVCLDCHAERDWGRFSAPLKEGTLGAGGEHFTREMGLPGDFYSKNITPAGIGEWSDGEVIRAITTGVTRDGRAMFPLMPYTYYRHLCERDVHALVAYVRTLKPIQKEVPDTVLDFPMSLIVRTIPGAPDPWACPKPGTPEHGKYLTTVAGCKECHTKQVKGEPVPGMDFAGGWEFPLPTGGKVPSANITPDEKTGIGKWTKEQFVAKFKSRAVAGAATPVAKGEANTVMPWTMYGGMSEDDLGAIYDHLRKQKAIEHAVAAFTP